MATQQQPRMAELLSYIKYSQYIWATLPKMIHSLPEPSSLSSDASHAENTSIRRKKIFINNQIKEVCATTLLEVVASYDIPSSSESPSLAVPKNNKKKAKPAATRRRKPPAQSKPAAGRKGRKATPAGKNNPVTPWD
jgi:hypothetical protein